MTNNAQQALDGMPDNIFVTNVDWSYENNVSFYVLDERSETPVGTTKYIRADKVEALMAKAGQNDSATIDDYEEVLADHKRLVRELDVALNGEDAAAKQASLCDIVGQVKDKRWKLVQADQKDSAKAALDGWMPIESAPKDGRWILLHYHEDFIPDINFWLKEQKSWAMKPRYESMPYTHWMPLPAAPTPPKG